MKAPLKKSMTNKIIFLTHVSNKKRKTIFILSRAPGLVDRGFAFLQEVKGLTPMGST